jgi:valyl-tRNA synthetase
METGGDILYAWVSRMLMLGLYATGMVPFKDVYLHGMVLDEKGQKMSKSKGNVVNPMETLATYGSDALRLGITASRSPGQSQAFSTGKVIAGRNFANKLWNVARYIENKLGENYKPGIPEPKTLADHWIISELNMASSDIGQRIEKYRFAEAGDSVYHAIWDSVADWYVEVSKQQNNPDLLAWVLDTSLKIAHPFAPFVTETIWQTLSWHDDLLITTPWPEPIGCDEIASAEFGRLKYLIAEIRLVTSELPGNKRYRLLYGSDSLIDDNSTLIQELARLKEVTRADQPKGLRLPNSGREAWLDVPAETLHEHQTNLEIRLAEVHADIANLKARLSNESYVKKAPEKLINETKEQLVAKQTLVNALEFELEVLR